MKRNMNPSSFPPFWVTVSRASLHNQDELTRKDIRIGDTVTVQRAGDVIPEVIKVIVSKRPKGSKPYQLPKYCPACGSVAIRIEEEASLRCTGGFSCSAQLKESIKHFASRRALDIEGLGEKLISQLVDQGLIKSPLDIYNLTATQISGLERMAKKSANNLIESIERSKKTTLTRLIFGLGIRTVGEATARTLADHFGSLESLSHADQEDLMELQDIGPGVAKSIYTFFEQPHHSQVIQKLLDAGIQCKKTPSPKRGKLDGFIFLFTGALSSMSREEAKNMVESYGGKTASSLSNKVTHVVIGREAGTKANKARALKLEIMSEEEFLELLKEKKKSPEK